jgi:hypothetical protein
LLRQRRATERQRRAMPSAIKTSSRMVLSLHLHYRGVMMLSKIGRL